MRIRQFENRLEIRSPAKVNLFLEIKGRRPDGFHELETVISQVSLFNTVEFERIDDPTITLSVTGGNPSLSQDFESNLIVRALRLLQSEVSNNRLGMAIRLTKRIPLEAGLGGGSSNAAAALVAGNRLWKLGLSDQEIQEIGARLGSDVPCFLSEPVTLCHGRGEKVRPLVSGTPIPLVLVKPSFGLSTAKVYAQYRNETVRTHDEFRRPILFDGLRDGDARRVAAGLRNDLEAPAQELHAGIRVLKDGFQRMKGCLGHQMSGSGSSYFGIFKSFREARIARWNLQSMLPSARTYCLSSLSLNRRRQLCE